MDILFPKERFVCPEKLKALVSKLMSENRISELPKRAQTCLKREWLKHFKEEAGRRGWKILRMERNWKVPIREGFQGYLWNYSEKVSIRTIPLKRGYYIVTKQGVLRHVVPHL
jgi:hypothetical protein